VEGEYQMLIVGASISKLEKCTLSKTRGPPAVLKRLRKRTEERGVELWRTSLLIGYADPSEVLFPHTADCISLLSAVYHRVSFF
jgi:hypothetical protein